MPIVKITTESIAHQTPEALRKLGRQGVRLEDLRIEMLKPETDFILHLAETHRPAKLLEIGVSSGGTSALLLSQLGADQMLHSVDLNSRYYRDPTKPVGFCVDQYCNARMRQQQAQYYGVDATQVIDAIGDGIDFLIIDTSHVMPGELLSFLTVMPYLEDGCVVVLHDIALNICYNLNPQVYFYKQYAYVTKVIFNTVCADAKFTLNGMNANIGAFIYEKANFERNAESLFSCFSYTWFNYPADLIALFQRHIGKHYPSTLQDMFNSVLPAMKSMVDYRNAYIASIKESAKAEPVAAHA